MPVETYIEQARTHVRAEQDAVDEKLESYGTFIRRVRDLQPAQAPSSVAGTTTTGGATHLSADVSGTDRCRTVRTAFDETIRPHSVADIDGSESLLETIREEFTDVIAVALSPTTDTSFTPDLKQLLLAEARSRRSEAATFRDALDREDAQLAEAAAAVDDITAWLVETNETPLTNLGFDALKQRHETLADHRDRCANLVRDRQSFLRTTTNDGVDTGVSHRRLTPYLYQAFPVDHPVLATAATLDETCRDCQRAVRDQLIRTS